MNENQVKFEKKCPICNKQLIYTDKWTLEESILKNRKCKSCSRKGKLPAFYKDGKLPDTILNKIKKSWFKKGDRPKNADFRKGKKLEEIYGVEQAKEIKHKFSLRPKPTEESNKRRRISCINAGCGKLNKGKKTTDKLKKLFRQQMVERLMLTNKNFHPPYNKNGCEYFNKLMLENKCNIQHALNGGEYYIKELGYWLDGYDKENNIAYEWDEKRHFDINGNLKQKDINRQREIEDFLKCKFVRIKETDII